MYIFITLGTMEILMACKKIFLSACVIKIVVPINFELLWNVDALRI